MLVAFLDEDQTAQVSFDLFIDGFNLLGNRQTCGDNRGLAHILIVQVRHDLRYAFQRYEVILGF